MFLDTGAFIGGLLHAVEQGEGVCLSGDGFYHR